MINSMMFPGRYFQGKNALLQLAERTAYLGSSYLMIGSKSALKAAREKIEKSFEGRDCTLRFELSDGNPINKEYERLDSIVKEMNPDVVVAIGGGGIIDMTRSAAFLNDKPLIVIPTTIASDAACTNVSLHYEEDGTVIGPDVHTRNPNIVFVDSTIIAEAPEHLMVSGIGDAMATYYEARTCYDNGITNPEGVGVTYTTLKMAESCRDTLFEYAEHAMMACRNNIVTPALERVIEACAFTSGVAALNAGCSGAHGFGDIMSQLPGGHSKLHGDRVAVGLIMQMIIEGYDSDEINEMILFYRSVGMPVSVVDLGYENYEETARFIAKNAVHTMMIDNMNNIDTSEEAIYGACIMAVKLGEEYAY